MSLPRTGGINYSISKLNYWQSNILSLFIPVQRLAKQGLFLNRRKITDNLRITKYLDVLKTYCDGITNIIKKFSSLCFLET